MVGVTIIHTATFFLGTIFKIGFNMCFVLAIRRQLKTGLCNR